ncbi:AAA family ATPase [Microvirga lotononidis]|uniref:Putative ATPase n=1 Tax=Microvirga lotononidis TaxID=864069 RepID=I4YZH9_9HYPH|nr:AAA family ATPase [Microvirga lotononidis]EIM29371.1 putative ATPase [Microvirga lotononidis]WQO29196.1 AAA family ATPase [Microvirga lotononidis]
MLVIKEVFAAGYRSLRHIRFPVEPLSVFVGGNGTGKTNLYRALQLLQAAAAGTLTHELAAEGGFDSVYWAGPRSGRDPVRVRLGVRLSGESDDYTLEYGVETGLVELLGAGFDLEPQIKVETLTYEARGRSKGLLERRGPRGHCLDEAGVKRPLGSEILPSETALGSLQDAAAFPDLHLARRTMLEWRFFHGFRTDASAPLRKPALAVTSPTLASDGSNLAAVFATLAHIRQDTTDLDEAFDDAFPGARLVIPEPDRFATFGVIFPDYPKRVFQASELSDGTLHFLTLAGALLSYRLPPFIALNEPETSLHPDLLEPLARMIVAASKRTQVWLVTHSEPLADAIARNGGVSQRQVIKRKGETWIDGLRLSGDFAEEEEEF